MKNSSSRHAEQLSVVWGDDIDRPEGLFFTSGTHQLPLYTQEFVRLMKRSAGILLTVATFFLLHLYREPEGRTPYRQKQVYSC